MKHHCLIFTVTKIWKILLMQITCMQKECFFCKDFEMKYLGEHHDLYVQSDTLLLADAFVNFRNMCIKIYKLYPAKFLSTPGLALQASLKNNKIKLDVSTEINM